MANAKNSTSETPMTDGKIQVLVVSAPAGSRRRAGFGFGPVPVELTEDALGKDAETIIKTLRSDPMLKLDIVEREVTAGEQAAPTE